MQHARADCEIEAPRHDERSGRPLHLRLERTVIWR